MQHVAVCLPVTLAGLVLLGWKQRGFGQGKLVGIGGKVEPGEEPATAAARELHEEAGLAADPARLTPAARLTFLFPNRPAWDHLMHVFVASEWTGQPQASDEIVPEWRSIDALPFDRMWDDGRDWLPRVLSGQFVAASYVYGEDGATVVAIRREQLEARTAAL